MHTKTTYSTTYKTCIRESIICSSRLMAFLFKKGKRPQDEDRGPVKEGYQDLHEIKNK